MDKQKLRNLSIGVCIVAVIVTIVTLVVIYYPTSFTERLTIPPDAKAKAEEAKKRKQKQQPAPIDDPWVPKTLTRKDFNATCTRKGGYVDPSDGRCYKLPDPRVGNKMVCTGSRCIPPMPPNFELIYGSNGQVLFHDYYRSTIFKDGDNAKQATLCPLDTMEIQYSDNGPSDCVAAPPEGWLITRNRMLVNKAEPGFSGGPATYPFVAGSTVTGVTRVSSTIPTLRWDAARKVSKKIYTKPYTTVKPKCAITPAGSTDPNCYYCPPGTKFTSPVTPCEFSCPEGWSSPWAGVCEFPTVWRTELLPNRKIVG